MRTGYVGEADRLPLEALFLPPLPDARAPAASGTVHHPLLVLSVSAGSGHVRAAQAICAAANAETEVARHIDVMQHVWVGLRKLYTDCYLALVNRRPLLWSWLYRATNDARPDALLQRLRRTSEQWCARRLLEEIERVQPRAIVCTHFLPAELLARLKREGRLDCPLWVQVTDFDLHRMWMHAGVTGYFAASDEVAFRLRRAGIAPERIRVTGIPVMPGFSTAPDRWACARALGLNPARATLLLMAGGAGLGRMDKLARRLLQLTPRIQVIALAGRNTQVLDALRDLAGQYRGRLVAHGYTDHVERLMACSDIVVTKPGGLTSAECLAMGLPMIVHGAIPGQEERNADYLLEQGVALKACDEATLEYRVRQLLDNPGQLAVMRRRALALSRANAAREVAATVLAARR